MKSLVLVLASLALWAHSESTLAQDCDPAFVQPGLGKLVVSPSGGDDSANLQCALEAARDLRLATVTLTAGDFQITRVSVEKFSGSLVGQGEAETVLSVSDGSLDCDAVWNLASGETPSALRFVGGSPRMRFLTLRVGQPCTGSANTQAAKSYVAVHFTGFANVNQCEGADVVFAEMDRVTLEGPGMAEGATYGVAAYADALGPAFDRDDCMRPLRGSFDLQRSTVTGFRIGARAELDNAGRVVIASNVFDTNRTHFLTWFGQQFLTIDRNSFSNPVREDGNVGVSFQAKTDATGYASIINNRFEVNSLGSDKAYGVLVGRLNQSDRNPINISGNTFNLDGDASYGVNVDSNAAGVITQNVFRGQGAVGISVKSPSVATPCLAFGTQWGILNNEGLDRLESNVADVNVECVKGVVVGPWQQAEVSADPDNFVLEQ